VILTATSGDTGKAALAGFADVPGTKIIVFYPKSGVSAVQEKQMVTEKGKNTHVVAIKGNFDDAQTGVKEIFNNKELIQELDENGYQFSSANSINIGRLIPQVAYYVYTYAKLLENQEIENGEAINLVVPTGNFGNILAAFYAKEMGIPVNKLICASNDNKVLYDFFKAGSYNRNRDFILTSSPSMDILISSNLERLIYSACQADSKKNLELMNSLNQDGIYTITEEMKEYLKDFQGDFATEAEVAETIRRIFKETNYLLDTHTAVAAAVREKYKKENSENIKTVIISTASPYKFARSVMEAIDDKYGQMEDFALIDIMKEVSGVELPKAIEEIRNAEIKHKTVVEVEEMEKTVKAFLGL